MALHLQRVGAGCGCRQLGAGRLEEDVLGPEVQRGVG